MTIYEEALKKIYAAHQALMDEPSHEHMWALLGTVHAERMITGDPNGKDKVGLIHGKSVITSLRDKSSR